MDTSEKSLQRKDPADTVSPQEGYTVYRVIKTISMVLIWICMGFFLEIAGPTLTDLKNGLSVNYEEISRVLSARSAGYFLGSLVGGFLKDVFPWHVDIILGCSLVVAGICTGITPLLPDLILVGVVFHIVGWCEGFLDTGGNALLLQMWGTNAPSPVQSIHFGFGVGAFLSPYLARPFLATSNTTTMPTNESAIVSPSSFAAYSESHIEVPYLIIGAVTMCTGVLFFVFQVIKRKYETISSKEDDNAVEEDDIRNQSQDRWKAFLDIVSPASCANGSLLFGCVMFIFLFKFYINVVGGERAYGKFIASFAKESSLKFSQDDAIFLNSIFWAGFMVGRFISIILAHWVSPKIMVPCIITGSVATFSVLCACWELSPYVIWVCSFFAGFFISPVFPTGVLWSDRYLTMTGLAISVLFLGGATGGFIYQWLTGYMFEYYGPPTLMYIMVGYCALLAVLYIIMQVIAHLHGDRYDKEFEKEVIPTENVISTTTL